MKSVKFSVQFGQEMVQKVPILSETGRDCLQSTSVFESCICTRCTAQNVQNNVLYSEYSYR